MKANLSLVLDKEGYVRLDLKKDLELSEIDKYTTLYTNSNEIRKYHMDEINSFLEEHESYIRTFKRKNDNGRIVIIYEDEKHRLHSLRVLYKESLQKLDVKEMIENIRRTLSEKESFNTTLDVINHFSGFIFGSEFDRKEIGRLKIRLSTFDVSEKLYNKRLVKNIIYNHLILTLNRNREKAYFYVRLIDSYMEKQGLYSINKEKSTKNVQRLKVRDVPAKTKVIPKQMNTMIMDGNFYMEDDGQYNLFESSDLNSEPVEISYEDYLEKEEERRLNK